MSELHAKYSPSAASRWMVCPGSVPATAELHATGSEHNQYTASGSVIHALGEMLLRSAFLEDEDYRPILDHALKEKWGYYYALPDEFAVMPMTEDMVDQAEQYLYHARSLVTEDDIIGIESRLTYSTHLFGTADLVLINDERMVICDLKTGAGNLVSPVENKQLMTYAGMALATLKTAPKAVHLAIIQPPDEENVLKVWETTPEVIFDHMLDVEQAMVATHLKAGEHCRWCPCRASCSELHALATNAASLNLDGLTPEGWKDALELAAILKPWCESVYQRANQLATEEGLNIPGYKLVQKMGRKTWASEKEAGYALTEALDAASVDLLETPQLWNEPKLRTPTQLKKELKGVIDPELIEGLTSVPLRGTILVPASDKRDAIDTGDNLLQAAEQLAFFS